MAKSGRSSNISSYRSSKAFLPEAYSEALSMQSSCLSTSERHKAFSERSSQNQIFSEDCEGDFTFSGSDPPKTVGPLSKCHRIFAEHAPCGHWTSCDKEGCKSKKNFEACETCPSKAPYGPYGPWSKNGPTTFASPKTEFLKKVYPSPSKRERYGLNCCTTQPMGRLAPWPLSGSCRYAGRPYGPCRPFGAYKSRGPFGIWSYSVPECYRPQTPCQPCWRPSKRGCRPCTPCYRPLFRPCKPC